MKASVLVWRVKRRVLRLFVQREVRTDNLVILCNQRAGSTWLLDTLRAHPAISMDESGGFFHYFDLDGSRYPVDLSNQRDDNTQRVEVLPRRYFRVPDFTIPGFPEHDQCIPQYRIEKVHPEFYRFNTQKFIKKIRAQEQQGKQFKIILLVREPLATLQSFYLYQQRNPKWYGWLAEGELVDFMLKTYQSLAEFKASYGGYLVTYANMFARPHDVVADIWRELWDAPGYYDSLQFGRDVEASIQLTRREERLKTGTPFLGEEQEEEPTDLPFLGAGTAGKMLELQRLFDRITA